MVVSLDPEIDASKTYGIESMKPRAASVEIRIEVLNCKKDGFV